MRRLLISLIASGSLGWMCAGESPCGTCHAAEARTQPTTSMALALQQASVSKILKEHPSLQLTSAGYTYDLKREGEVIRYAVTGRGQSFTAVIPWAFGLGSAGQTYLYEKGGIWYESRVSFYSAINGLDITIGHRGLPIGNIEDAAGRRLQKSEATRCFGCHSTGSPGAITAGVQCERCHENATQHARDLAGHPATAAATPPKLGEYDSEQMADFCGGCHRTWQEIAANGPHDINNVRLQPYRLVSSKCYEASLLDKRLSCVACHNPHHEVERSAGFYDAKCKACHRPTSSAGKAIHTCPKATSGCVECHMPNVELPEAHFKFTDHRIRIVRAGEPYPN